MPNTVPTPPGITIYFIRNRTNHRVYVGQTMDLRRSREVPSCAHAR